MNEASSSSFFATECVSNRPRFSRAEAGRLAREMYGLEASVAGLPSTADQNFALCSASRERFVLKIANAGTSLKLLECHSSLLKHIAEHGDQTEYPQLVESTDGRLIHEVVDSNGTPHFVRLLTWLPGVPFANADQHTPELLQSLGSTLGRLSAAIDGFAHPETIRETPWDLARALDVTRHCRSLVTEAAKVKLMAKFVSQYEEIVAPRLGELRQSVLHSDANDYNVLVETLLNPSRVTGIIDFDPVYSHTVNELAIGLAYAMLDKDDPVATAAHILKSYHHSFSLTELEVKLLYPLSCMRLCVSVLMSAHNRQFVPDDEYLSISEQPSWRTLARLQNVSPEDAYDVFSAGL